MIARAFFMSLGMFSVFPVPKDNWNNECAHLVIPLLPAVGAVIGLVWYAAAGLLIKAGLHPVLTAAFVLLIPFFLSGFLHTDGYMDTADAVLSRRTLAERRRILKDSHTGAFAVVMAICLFLMQYCAVFAVIAQDKPIAALALIPVLSRAAAGLALLRLKPISDTGYLSAFKANTKPVHTLAPAAFAIISLALALPAGALPALAAEAIAAGLITAAVYKQLDGLSGDLCGCIITVAELAALIGLAVFK